MKINKILIVGSGFAGAVLARELARKNIKIDLIDKRNHIGGNCHTKRDLKTGVMEHVYGPHIFNTNNVQVWNYVNKFGEFMPFINRIKVNTSKGIFSFPINLMTINQFFKTKFSPNEAKKFINKIKSKIKNPKNFEEQILSLIGKKLYKEFFYGYTIKQWGVDPKKIPASVAKRIPIRYNYDDNFNKAKFTGIPKYGYTKLIEKILKHKNIKVTLGKDYKKNSSKKKYDHIFFSGEIDKFFNYKFGKLGYRTVYWKKKYFDGDFQGTAGVNYPELKVKHTRIYEHKHFMPSEKHKKSIVFYEYSKETKINDEPFYPKRLEEDKVILKKYQNYSKKFKNITFIGRLGTYQYLDMEDVIFQSIKLAKKFSS